MPCWQTTSARPPRATASNSARSGPTAANYSPPQNSSAQSTTEECQRRSGPVVSDLAPTNQNRPFCAAPTQRTLHRQPAQSRRYTGDPVKRARRAGVGAHGAGLAGGFFFAVAGAEEEGEPVQVCAQGIGVVGGVADEGGQAFLKGRFLAARQPAGQEGEHLCELGRVARIEGDLGHWWSAPFGLGALDEPVEQRGPLSLPVVAGVVALPGKDGQELGAGAEAGAGLAGGLRAAVQLGGPGAQAVAEHPGVGLAAQPGHAGALVVGGQR